MVRQRISVLNSCHQVHCQNVICLKRIQDEYDILISTLKDADANLPRFKAGIEKSWWTSELQELKQKSIDITEIWKNEGRPRNGPTNQERLNVRAVYKKAIKRTRVSANQQTWEKLHDQLADKDTDGFWKSWKRLHNNNKSHLPSVINGISSKNEIAQTFKSHFEKHSKPNNANRVDALNHQFQDKYHAKKAGHCLNCQCKEYNASLNTVVDSIFSMKKGKSCDDEGLHAEHFFNAPFSFFQRMQALINAILNHAFVPWQFQYGTIVPIAKDPHGNLSDTENYRGITMSPILSKVLEHTLRCLFSGFLTTSRLQFGFKSGSSTIHAVHLLKETVNYYCEHGSNVFCSFLDASKAFDRVVHSGLFLKMLNQNVPLIFLDLIMYWYSNLFCRVRWEDQYSDWFFIMAGVRQGGILSPDFYSLYVDDLIPILSKLNVGCHIKNQFVSAIFYADDMALLSPSLRGLQKLLDACQEFCNDWDICLNPKKSKNLYFGKRIKSLANLKLNGCDVEWTEKWPYLGIILHSHTCFNCCVSEKVRKFYRALNCILRIEGRSNDLLVLRLIEIHCIPILTYGIEIISVANRDTRRQMRVAYNAVFRRIFNYRQWQSVRELQAFLSRPTWEELTERRISQFLHRLKHDALLISPFVNT